MINERPATMVLDIDGTLINHCGNICDQYTNDIKILPGVLNKFKEWDLKGYRIILMTGRRESGRKHLEEQLFNAGIFYDQLIMGVGNGKRILINDLKPNSEEPTAIAINVKRNSGLEDIKI